MRKLSWILMIVFGGILSLFWNDSDVVFAQTFVTNTPPPPDPLSIGADAPMDQYALRLWTEQDLLDVLSSQLNRLAGDQMEQALAIQLTQFELEKRFPGSPRNLVDRERILNLMLEVPRGTVDMRWVVRPHIVTELNNLRDTANESTLMIDGFLVQMVPFNLDTDGIVDALLTVRFPADAVTPSELLYKDYWVVRGREDGGFEQVESFPHFPVTPFNQIEDIILVRTGDINSDGVDEVALALDTGAVNNEILIYGWRNGQIANIVEPHERILYGELVGWPEGLSTLMVGEYRVESSQWECLASLQINWEWANNFYRADVGDNPAYQNLPTVGCALHMAGNLFALPPTEATVLVKAILEDSGLDQQGANRGGMALAMLYYLNNQPNAAEEQTARLLTAAESDPWLARQIDAFSRAVGQGGLTPAQICAALILEEEGACDVDGVIAQILNNHPVMRVGDLVEQLENQGLPVQDVVTVEQVGRATRQVVNFDLAGSSWWSFAPTDPDFYVPEPVAPPVAIADVQVPSVFVTPPPTAYDLLFESGEPAFVLNIIDNASMDAADVPLAPSTRYLLALSLDLMGNRESAREAYYDLWVEDGGGLWGQLAGAHLEKR